MRVRSPESLDDVRNLGILIILALLLVAELFLIPGHPQTFDEWTHLFTMKQFFLTISEGEFPVRWVQGVANYGYPLGQVAHQVPAYLGAFFIFLTGNTILSYNLTLLVAAASSTIAMYLLLRRHVREWPALAGAALFCFAPYRILNIYVRGAIPEFFSTTWIITLLIGINLVIQKRQWFKGGTLVAASVALIILTHPMMMLIGSIFAGMYVVILLLQSKKEIRKTIAILVGAGAFGIGLTAYYALPLFLEMKYFNYGGNIASPKGSYQFMRPDQYLAEIWNYHYPSSPGVREDLPQLGVLELAVWCLAVIVFLRYRKSEHALVALGLSLAGVILALLTLPIAAPLYTDIPLLGAIQYPWRILTATQLVAPLLLALLLDRDTRPATLAVATLVLIGVVRFPQLYGKNYVYFPESTYDFTTVNVHGSNMNTVWTGNTTDYPITQERIRVIEGTAEIEPVEIKPSTHRFQLLASTDTRIADYTFYFPGWTLLVDGKPYQFEFQDPEYRGFVTYRLPPGKYAVEMTYENTKVRKLGNWITALSALLFAVATAVALKRKRQG